MIEFLNVNCGARSFLIRHGSSSCKVTTTGVKVGVGVGINVGVNTLVTPLITWLAHIEIRVVIEHSTNVVVSWDLVKMRLAGRWELRAEGGVR